MHMQQQRASVRSPSVVPAAKLKPMAGLHVLPARVWLLARTVMLVMSMYAWLYSTGPVHASIH